MKSFLLAAFFVPLLQRSGVKEHTQQKMQKRQRENGVGLFLYQRLYESVHKMEHNPKIEGKREEGGVRGGTLFLYLCWRR